MRLLFCIHSLNLGGTENALLSLVNELNTDKYEITLLLLENKGELFKNIPNKVKIEFLKDFKYMKPIIFDPPYYYAVSDLKKRKISNMFKTLFRYGKIKITGSWVYNFKKALKEYPIQYKTDIAVAFAGPSDFISYLILNNVDAKRKYQWIHFDITKIITNTNFGNQFYPQFDKILCVSENARNTFAKTFPQVESKTEVFENIVSENLIKHQAEIGETYTDSFDGIRILTLGRLSEEKGQQMIPAVVKRLKDDGLNFRWYLIGEGKLRAELEEQIKKLGIENELILLGLKINPYAYLKDCDLYVQTSLHEGYGITIHEAKIFNRPVVTTAVLSASNLIANNEDGLIVPICENGIYVGVNELIKNEKKRNDFSRFIKKDELQNSNKIEALFSKYFSNSNFN